MATLHTYCAHGILANKCLTCSEPAELMRLVLEANRLLRGVHVLVARKGAETDWAKLDVQVQNALVDQHAALRVSMVTTETFKLKKDLFSAAPE